MAEVKDPEDKRVTDKAVNEAMKREDDAREEAQREIVHKVLHGFAPPRNDADPRSREEIEADILGTNEPDAKRAVGSLIKEKRAAHSSAGHNVHVRSDAEEIEKLEDLRSPRGAPVNEKEVIIDGVRYLVRAGDDVKVPGPVAEALENAAKPVRIAQMSGHFGLPTVDLTGDDD